MSDGGTESGLRPLTPSTVSSPSSLTSPSTPGAVETPRRVSVLRRAAMFPIRVYIATLSWLLGGQCRFTPSCSRYGLEAIEKHGPIKGWWMAITRVLRCHPFNPGGYDPVPEPDDDVTRDAECGCGTNSCATKK